MRAQLAGQVQDVELAVKTKEIRLDRLVRNPDFISAASRAPSVPPVLPATTRCARNSTESRVRSIHRAVNPSSINTSSRDKMERSS